MPGEGDVYEPSLCLDDDSLLGMTGDFEIDDLEAPPQDADFHQWFNHGLARLKSGQWKQARSALALVVEKVPAGDALTGRAHALHGYASAKLGRHKEAVASYESAIQSNPVSIEAMSGLACVMFELGQFA